MQKVQAFISVLTVLIFSSIEAATLVAPKDALCGLNESDRKSYSITYGSDCESECTVDIPLSWLLDANNHFSFEHTWKAYLASSTQHKRFFQNLYYKLKKYGHLPQDYKDYIKACEQSGQQNFLSFSSSELEVVQHFAVKSILNLQRQFCWLDGRPFIKSTGPEGLLSLKHQQPQRAQAVPVVLPNQSSKVQNSPNLNPKAPSFVPKQ